MGDITAVGHHRNHDHLRRFLDPRRGSRRIGLTTVSRMTIAGISASIITELGLQNLARVSGAVGSGRETTLSRVATVTGCVKTGRLSSSEGPV